MRRNIREIIFDSMQDRMRDKLFDFEDLIELDYKRVVEEILFYIRRRINLDNDIIQQRVKEDLSLRGDAE